MHVTFLAHSGFLVELEHVLLLFDWQTGTLPPLPDKPLLVFASHRHDDHFHPGIFFLAVGRPETRFLLGKGIRLSPHNCEKWDISPERAAQCTVLRGGECITPRVGVTVEALPSTDIGVAFVVTAEGKTIYHAGDLNWWHWEENGKAWNGNMAANFKRFLAPLQGRHIDLAFAPLDPRLGDAYDWGFRYLLDTAEIRRILPMHQWGDFAATERFLTAHPEYSDRVVPVTENGQRWTF